MKSVLHMSLGELLDKFGMVTNGERKVSSDMVQWLLSGPSEAELHVASILKAPVAYETRTDVPPGKIYLMPAPPKKTIELKLDLP